MNTPSIGSIFHTPEVIAWAGDWHANFLWARRAVMHAAANGAKVILHTGDFGYNYIGGFIGSLEHEAARWGILILFVRGNHDDPDYLDDLEENDEGFKPLSPHIWYIPQGTAWSWDGVKFMGLGGAHSVDRPRRQQDSRHGSKSWWERETISTVDMYKAAYNGPTDILLTHDCPAGVAIPGLDKPNSWHPTELALAHRNRERLYEVTRRLKPKMIVHGHYHTRYAGHLDIGHDYHVKIVGLDCDDSTMVTNMAFSTMKALTEGDFNARS